MAFAHIQFDETTQHGRMMRQWLAAVETVLDRGADLMATIPTMVDGSTADAANFTEVKNRFGTPDNATAKALFDEFSSAYFKVSQDGDVSSVNAALNQVCAKCR